MSRSATDHQVHTRLTPEGLLPAVKQHIVRLDVTVRYQVSMQEIQCRQEPWIALLCADWWLVKTILKQVYQPLKINEPSSTRVQLDNGWYHDILLKHRGTNLGCWSTQKSKISHVGLQKG